MGAYEFLTSIQTTMKFAPQTLNRKSKGPKEIKAFFTLPEEMTQDDIIDQPFLLCPSDSDYCI